MTAGEQFVVRVRIKTFCWTSGAMPEAEAHAMASDLILLTAHIGDGVDLVGFRASAGRDVTIRAREVTAVEVMPWTERMTPEPGAGPRLGHRVADFVADSTGASRHDGPPASGTEFLRQQAAHGGQVRR